MDLISGINKVIVHTDDIENASVVTATGLPNANVTSNTAEFMIPGIPVPGRQLYTFKCGEFEKTIDVGYGQITEIWLHPNYDNVQVGGLASVLAPLTEAIDNKINKVAESLKAEDKDKVVHTFKFGVDADGNYGYIKKVDGADSVIPFKTGVHIKSLGVQGGRGKASYTVSVTDIMSDKEYKKLTADNFFLVPQPVAAAVDGDQNGAYRVSSSYTPPKKSYDATKGVLTVTASKQSVAGLTSGFSYGTEEVFVVY